MVDCTLLTHAETFPVVSTECTAKLGLKFDKVHIHLPLQEFCNEYSEDCCHACYAC